jgi:hypothetical protein
VKKVPYIVSSQVAVTEYEKEPYSIERTFEQTQWEKIPYQVTIEEPYVTEFFQSYTAQILVPYEVTTTMDLTFYELEEYLVQQEVPFVVESVETIVDVQQELFETPTVTKTTHAHELLHDIRQEPEGTEVTLISEDTFVGEEAIANAYAH